MKLRSVGLLVPFLLSLPCAAQSQEAAQEPQRAEPTEGIDDVVIVQGWRHPVQLRLQMVEAELAVYELFNQLTKDNSLMLECSKRNIGGTRLMGTDCAPRFESEALAREGQDVFDSYRAMLNATAMTQGNFAPGAQNLQGNNTEQFSNFAPVASGQPATLQIRAGQNRLKREMDRIAAEHPEFLEQVTKYVDAKTRYTQALTRADD
jgi:hypothetical protein